MGVALIAGGLLLWATALYGLWQDWAWVAQPFYAWVWWGYILWLDGFVVWRRGDSLLTVRRLFVPPICIWSITFWFFFELINARIRNWYYVGVYPFEEFAAGTIFTLLAFATVFLGLFETCDAVTSTGLWKGWKHPAHSFPPWLTYGLQAGGLGVWAIALLFPYYLAPLVWGCFTLVVDPWNYRRGTRSLLRDIESGDYGLIARLLLSGLICGVVWESLNFFAPQKWIYTVRGLEGFKIFEMPLLGFLGFPALALDSMAAFALLASFFLGNRSWERPDDLSYRLEIRRPVPRRVFFGSVLVQALFWAAVAHFATPVNVGSIKLELDDLGLGAAEVRELRQLGVNRPRQLLRVLNNGRTEVLERLDWSAERADSLRDRTALYTFKGIGPYYGALLEHAGIRIPTELAHADPEELHAELQRLAPELGMIPPRLDFVKAWVLAARHLRGHPSR